MGRQNVSLRFHVAVDEVKGNKKNDKVEDAPKAPHDLSEPNEPKMVYYFIKNLFAQLSASDGIKAGLRKLPTRKLPTKSPRISYILAQILDALIFSFIA